MSITEANRDFSKVTRIVDENGSVIILKDDVPRYVVTEFSKSERLKTAPDEDIEYHSTCSVFKN